MTSSSTAHSDGETLIQSWANTYDEVGNLRTRTRSDAVNDAPSSESFTYDQLNRLKTSEVTLSNLQPIYDQTDTYDYDALGNRTQKNAIIYTYGTGCTGPAGPHAICTVAGGPGYGYDANGNMTSGAGRSVTYNVANKPTEIIDDSLSQTGTVEFAYGADGNRVLQVASNSQGSSRTVYVGLGETGKSLYERTTIGGVPQHTFFIYAGGAHSGNAFAVRVLDDNGHPAGNDYFNFDHLGSTTAVSDDKGHVASVASAGSSAGVLGYDPWGARRNPDGQAADPTTFSLQPGHREFTGHETIPTIGLVNMNGRIYDPVVGRFLSPDPNVQSPKDLQSYNRYSYVLNNPLRYTDPTGYFSIGGALPGILLGLVSIGACAVAPGVGCAIAAVIITAGNVGVARQEGASWGQIALSTGIGLLDVTLGGAAGGVLGGALGVVPGSAADFAANAVGGAIGGAIGGAMQGIAAGRGGIGGDIFWGATQGAIWAAVGWGMKQPSPLTKADVADKGAGGSGESVAEVRAREAAAGRAAQGASASTSAAEFDRQLNDVLADAFGAKEIAAVQAAAQKFDLLIPSDWSIGYDQANTDHATTHPASKTVVFGPKAYESEGWLASTLGHELVHVNYQQALGNIVVDPESIYNNINEIEAYDWELENGARFGLTVNQVNTLQALRGQYIWGADPYYITQSMQGNYLVERGDRP